MEIERKFLVRDLSCLHLAEAKSEIVQAFLSRDAERIVRIRIQDGQGTLTVKSRTDDPETRHEWEYPIGRDDASRLLGICLPEPVVKTRYYIPHLRGLRWEVDVFHGDNQGLVIAEIELPAAGMTLVLPPWIGDEITADTKYYNVSLSEKSYSRW